MTAGYETSFQLEVSASLTCLVTLFQAGDAVILTFESGLRCHPVAALDAAITQHKAPVSALTLNL